MVGLFVKFLIKIKTKVHFFSYYILGYLNKFNHIILLINTTTWLNLIKKFKA